MRVKATAVLAATAWTVVGMVLHIPVMGAQDVAVPVLELSEIKKEALGNNPEILAARNRWQSARAIIEARRAFPDPQLSYTYFVENVETRVGPQRHIIGGRQTLPFYGKRGLRADVAAKEAEALKAVYMAVKDEVVRRVKKTYYDLFYVTKSIDITHEEKALLKRFERIARTKYATGGGSQQDILKVQVEISRLNDRLLSLSDQRQTQAAKLNTLVDKPPDRPLGKPRQPDLRSIYFIQEQLFELAKGNNPKLTAAEVRIQKSRKAHDLAKKDYYPDLTIGANYFEVGEGPLDFPDNGKDAFNVTFSINLPIWREKLASQVRSAQETIRAQRGSYHQVLNRVLFEVKDSYFKFNNARETVELYEYDLIPQAEQSLKAAVAGYITGIVSFLDLLDAERILLRIQYDYWRAYTDHLKYRADTEWAVGMELPEYPPEEAAPSVEE